MWNENGRGEETRLAGEGWNVVGGVDGKINTMSNRKQVFKRDFTTILNHLSEKHNARNHRIPLFHLECFLGGKLRLKH